MKTMSPKVLVSGILLVALASLISLAAGTPADQKWEYGTFDYKGNCWQTSQATTCGESLERKFGLTVGLLHYENLFDSLGAQGWEMFMGGPTPGHDLVVWFKRRR